MLARINGFNIITDQQCATLYPAPSHCDRKYGSTVYELALGINSQYRLFYYEDDE